MADVLFCSDDFVRRHAADLARVAPAVEILSLDGDAAVSAEDLHRITLAFFSSDLWPARSKNFFGAARRAENLQWLHTMSAGVDSPVFSAFLDQGVRLTNSSGSSAPPIARTALMYLLALTRDLPSMFRAQERKEWTPARWSELEGRSIAVVGWGPIGQEIARLVEAIGMRPTIVRRAAHGDEPYPVRPLAELPAIAADHDAMAVALPLTDTTRGIITGEVLRGLGPAGYFVNVGRGELVDQHALVAALEDGGLAGAGLDVATPEPLPADDPLWSAPNLILTPHNSGSTDGSARRADEIFLGNLERWVRGEALVNEILR